jgi:hypothetical protein
MENGDSCPHFQSKVHLSTRSIAARQVLLLFETMLDELNKKSEDFYHEAVL